MGQTDNGTEGQTDEWQRPLRRRAAARAWAV